MLPRAWLARAREPLGHRELLVPDKHQFAIGLGANLGSREAALRFAVDCLRHDEDVELVEVSSIYATEPVGPPQPDYLNAALTVRTALTPRELLGRLHAIEALTGRERSEARWGPRTLDLDLLAWDGETLDDDALSLPHRHLGERPFALAPLLEVWPELTPTYGPLLERTGGAAPRVGHLAAPVGVEVRDGLIRARGSTLADALVFALDAAYSVDCAEPPATRVLDPLIPLRFVTRTLACVGEGFRPWRTLIAHFDPYRVEGRLVGHAGAPTTLQLEWIRFHLDPAEVELRVGRSSTQPPPAP